MRLSSLVLVVVACGVLGCGGGDPAAPMDASAALDAAPPALDAAASDAGTPPLDAAAPDAQPPIDAGPPPSDEFVALYDGVIIPHCGGSECHAPGTRESTYFGYAPRLQMPDPTTARAVLVGRRVDCLDSPDDRIRVVPGDPASSAIMTVGEDGLCGRRHNVVVPDLTADDLAAIEAWIAGGAL